jgi:hypothetical protein
VTFGDVLAVGRFSTEEILDLRHVNLHLLKTSVKFEDIGIAMQLLLLILIVSNSICSRHIIMLIFLSLIQIV